MRKLFTLFLTMTMATALWAVPARQGTIRVTQKDGTVLTLQLVGDEYMHYYRNMETGEKMLRGDDGDYYVITDADYADMQSAAKVSMEQNNARRKARLTQKKTLGKFGNMTGNKKGIVILVNFSDVSMTTGTQTEFDDMFNKVGYDNNNHIGSVHDYFGDQSYGKFNLSFDVVGPVTVSNTMAYYGGNNSNGNDMHPAEMVSEACGLVDNLVDSQGDPLVNFADYDWDGDGTVDQVFVIYAGYGENFDGADKNTIWPHESSLRSTLTLDGVTISTYACTAELTGTSGSTLCGIGTACHEFSHCLGYPDFYDTDYSDGQGMGYFDIMSNGSYNGKDANGESPAGYTAYERWMAGWLTPTELTTTTDIADMPDLGSTASAYIIRNNATTNEYFLLENRQAERWFKYFYSNPAGHGLLITHIDYDATVWANNKPNDDKDHQRVTWVSADREYYFNATEFFPGTKNIEYFMPSKWTDTGGRWFNEDTNGTYYSSHYLTEIKESDGKISFRFDPALTTAGINISSVDYSTYYNSQSAYIMPDDCEGYVFSADKKLEAIYKGGDIVPAGEPLVVYTIEPGDKTLTFTTSKKETYKSADLNILDGTDEATTLTADDNYYFYALSLNAAGDASSVGFYWMNDTGAAFTNGAHKAYLKLAKTTPGAKAGYAFNEDATTTDLSEVKSGEVKSEREKSGEYYNLAGQRVGENYKGFVIKKGKKYLNK